MVMSTTPPTLPQWLRDLQPRECLLCGETPMFLFGLEPRGTSPLRRDCGPHTTYVLGLCPKCVAAANHPECIEDMVHHHMGTPRVQKARLCVMLGLRRHDEPCRGASECPVPRFFASRDETPHRSACPEADAGTVTHTHSKAKKGCAKQ